MQGSDCKIDCRGNSTHDCEKIRCTGGASCILFCENWQVRVRGLCWARTFLCRRNDPYLQLTLSLIGGSGFVLFVFVGRGAGFLV